MGKSFSELENNSGKRLIGIGAVILLHLIVLYGLITGLSKKGEKTVEEPVELIIIQDKKPEPEKPKPIEKPPEVPKMVKEVLKTPEQKPVEKVVQKTVTTTTTQTVKAVSTQTPTASPSPSPVASPTPTPAPAPAPEPPPKPAGETRGASKGSVGCKEPAYPREAEMAEETGTVRISVLVGADGNAKEVKVKKSTGTKSLDKSASKAYSLCTFKPALKNGEPVDDWVDIEYTFKLD
ncbi:energy transducer TonB [Acinetobacter sp. ANC 5054]|uniref:energy transducer TonB n=1 Tax=Acinetobacter sp. ANC 5054 TaxID=1977877 RepID=UPI000A340807|nr:energy transducer TonB [Acinetobacter sp. ANC 5054]OTG80546.1 energy transducer TonB [Acinetobacter sp. ANC 5054]